MVQDYTTLEGKLNDKNNVPVTSSALDNLPNGQTGIVFPPFSLGDLTTFFTGIIGVDLNNYGDLFSQMLGILKNIKITSEDAIKDPAQKDKGLSLVNLGTDPDSGDYQLEFAVEYDNTWEIIKDEITVEKFYIAFTITSKGVSAALSSGKIHFLTYDLDLQLTALVPSFLFTAELSADSTGNPVSDPNTVANQQLANDYVAALTKKGGSIEVIDIRFNAALLLQNYSLHLAVANVLDLHDRFSIDYLQVDIDYRGGTAGGSSILVYTNLGIGFDKDPLIISLVGRFEKNAGSKPSWLFSGIQAHPMPLKTIIEDICQLFGLPNSFHIPDFLAEVVVDTLELSFDGAASGDKDYSFKLRMTLPVEGKSLDVTISADFKTGPSGYALDLNGVIFIAGMEFDLEFKKTSDASGAKTSILEASYQSDTESIDLSQLLADITDDPDLTDALPDVKISLREKVLFVVYKGADAVNKYLFGLILDVGLHFDLGELPIVGKILKSQGEYGIKDFKFFLASQPFYEDEIGQFNADDQALIMGDHSAPQAATLCQRISLLSKGANFRATLNLGTYTKTIPQPPTGILPGAAPAPAPKSGEAGSTTSGNDSPADGTKPAKVGTGSVTNSQAQWLNIQKAIGPVIIERISVSFKDGKLWFYLTGSFTAAGLTITLDGLGIGAPIKDFSVDNISATLMGMSVDFQKGNLEISGGFVIVPAPLPQGLEHLYAGELIIKAEPFGLTVIGMYGSGEYDTMFIFGMLDFPIGGPPIFFVTGLAAGFGYNSKLNLPSSAHLNDYLLVQGALPAPAGGKNPLSGSEGKPPTSVLDQLTSATPPAVEPSKGDYWIAAGVRFTSYELVQSFALLVVSFGHHFELAVLGRSQISVPPLAPTPVAFAEIDLKAVLTPDAEPPTPVFSLEARLADGSFILDKAARLRGGLAFYFWANGDFVVTLGGYHPHFQTPDYYPRVDRLGMDWKLSSTLSISGGLYFALTPSALMAGGSLQALFQVNHIRAWFTAEVDFLMNFKPFHYDLSIQISLGISADVGLFSVNMHAGVGLDLWGPEFSGIATVDLTVISFSIEFGGDKSEPAPLTWNEFAKSFLPKQKEAADKPEVMAVRIADGLLKQDKSQADSIPVVNPLHFEIRTHTAVPVSAVQSTGDLELELADLNTNWNQAIGIVPMQQTGIQSIHYLDIQKKDEADVYQSHSLDRMSFYGVWEDGPKSLWLNKHPDAGDQLAKDTTIPGLLMGIRVQPKKLDPDHTFPVEISALLVELDEIEQYEGFLTPSTKAALTKPANVAAAEQQVGSALTNKKTQRQAILQALQAESLVDTEQLDVGHFNDPNLEALTQSPLFI